MGKVGKPGSTSRKPKPPATQLGRNLPELFRSQASDHNVRHSTRGSMASSFSGESDREEEGELHSARGSQHSWDAFLGISQNATLTRPEAAALPQRQRRHRSRSASAAPNSHRSRRSDSEAPDAEAYQPSPTVYSSARPEQSLA